MIPGLGETWRVARAFSQEQFDRFAALSGDHNPIHVDPTFAARTKFGRTVAHGMFLYANICQAWGELVPGAVQLEQELMFAAPTYADEPVTIELRSEGGQAAGVQRLETNIVKGDGAFGCRGFSLLRLAGTSAANVALGSAEAPRGTGSAWKGLNIGQSGTLERTYSAADLREYAELLNETNPLIVDPASALAQGFRTTLLPGPLLGALFSCLLGTQLPGPGTNWLKQRLLFPTAAYPGEALEASVQIVRIRPEKELVNLRTWVRVQGGAVVADGEALVWVSDLGR